MKLAVISDVHVLGPDEHEKYKGSVERMGDDATRMKRWMRQNLYRVRRRFWNTHPEAREACFHKALEVMAEYDPDWVVANGDYGGDTSGIGLSCAHTFDSARVVVGKLREHFKDRCRFVFGDHDIGKYATNLREGGIRLDSLYHGEEKLGIQSFWHVEHKGFDLVGVNSLLFTLEMFLPEALDDEIPAWKEHREEHIQMVSDTFNALPDDARVILFCHDPFALGAISELEPVRKKLKNIECTVLGHLHTPALLKLSRLLRGVPKWNPKYPVARIINEGLKGVKSWSSFNPVLCPSTFGAGHHINGGVLFIEADPNGKLKVRKEKVKV